MEKREIKGENSTEVSTYIPPEGIDRELFDQIQLPRTTFLLKTEQPEKVDRTVMKQCVEAVWELTDQVPLPEADVVLDKQEMREYVQEFTEYILESAQILAQEHTVAIIGAPTGGIAPLQAVMAEAVRRKMVDPKRIQFIPFIDGNAAVYEVVQRAESHILIDDGLAYMTSQAEYLYALESATEADAMMNQMKESKQRVYSCNDPSLIENYRQLMERFASHRVVVAPLLTKNEQFARVTQEVLQGGRHSSAWAQAQERFLQFPIRTIDEHKTTPGAMMEGIPCRDVGVTYGFIRHEITPEVQQRLDNGGIRNATTFRLLANREDVVSFGLAESELLRERFTGLLNEKLSK